jgi:amino acid adenylation domain-containing protein
MEKDTVTIDRYIAAAQSSKEKEYWLSKLPAELVKSHFYYDLKSKSTDILKFEKVEFRFTGELFSKFLRLSNNSDLRLHMILTAGLALLVEKYTGEKDIILGTPVYKEDDKVEFVNTVLVLRNIIDTGKTFKEFLVQVRQTILEAVENVNYPVELLSEQLGMPVSQENDFPLFDMVILLENIQDKRYIEHINYNIAFSLSRKEDVIEGMVEYNTDRYYKETIEKIISHFISIFQQVLFDVNLKICQVDIISEAEKRKLLNEFNDTGVAFPKDKTIHELFAEQAERTPGKIAVCSPIDLSDIFAASSCFKRNPYVFEADLGSFKILKTNTHHCVVINKNMLKLIDCFTGENNLESIFSILLDFKQAKFIIFTSPKKDLLGIAHDFNRRADVFLDMNYNDFISLVQLLHKNNLVAFHGVKAHTTIVDKIEPGYFDAKESFEDRVVLNDVIKHNHAGLAKADVLLLGDTQGMPTTGLLYMAAFLRSNGVKTVCRFYDDSDNFQAMAADIEKMLERTQPRVVGISMKWFLYIARVIDMCKIIKEYSQRHGLDIKVVVGGNTASYYSEEVITYDCIDYLVRGDGEEPLLKIVRGEKNIPNCIYKENGKIIENPITYIQDETNSTEIYLSHLDEILLDRYTSLFGIFFVYTHKGCAMNCLYCGGCNKAQQKAFNRKNVLRRGIEEIRKDIIAVKKYTSTFHFEFDLPDKNLADHCRKIWQGIDLSGHFCVFNTLTFPSTELVELVSRTFKYVYWDFDIGTPSERHRKQLMSLGLVKPLPLDAEIMDFMTTCENFKNIEVRPNLITGLPYFSTEDFEPGEKLLSEIMSTFSCFGELHWARLHAQPGAPILENAEQLQMNSFATSFEHFLEYSRETFNRDSGYVSVENFNYPYIYYKDDHLNSQITNFYLEINKKITQNNNDKANNLIVLETLSYGDLNERANRLAATLRSRGGKPGDIVGLILKRSIAIPVGILAILKCGAAYLPIDPEFPGERIKYMLTDTDAAALVTTRDLLEETDKIISWEGEKILLDALSVSSVPSVAKTPPQAFNSSAGHHIHYSASLAYIIYTSGTTGKPKGVAIKHENLVNYVNWFSNMTGLTDQDKTILTTSFAFDLGYTSLYNSLLNGCELHILPREMYLLAERLLSYIKQNKITFLKVTPALFTAIVHSPAFSKITCQSLRLAAMGGEPINVKDIEKAHSICSHIKIMNHYGPTETTIGCAATIIDFAEFEIYKTHPVIGKPVANTRIYILGKDFGLLPIGVPGELCISGAGVGRGYLNQPELTTEKFCLRQPGALFEKTAPGPRKNFPLNTSHKSYMSYISHRSYLYRTGDLARWLPNGTIEFLGRIDTQIKIRGYRIELGEIETRLAKHPAVEEAVVIVKEVKEAAEPNEKGNADKYICAYIVPRSRKEAAAKKMAGDKNKQLLPVKGIQRTSIAQLLEQAEKNHDKIAVKSNGRSLTYGSLDNLANQVAQRILAEYDDRYRLSKNERIRYKRQMLLHGWGIESQEKLKSTTVFVAGAGGGASPTIVQLALAGIGTIKVCDFDEVELSNLNRQFLHNEERLGMNKALSAQFAVTKINPHVKVIPYTGKLTRDNVFELVGDADIIFDMFDDPADKFILSECAVAKGIPHIIISMTDINAYTTVCHTPQTPCYYCLFDRKKLETIVSGMQNNIENYRKNPLPVVATSLFISTGIAVNEALKLLLGFKKPAYNKFFYFNQRGEEDNLVNTPGYKAMTYLFSDHFLQGCKEQGFDWDTGWRGNFLEELTIKPDPHCPLCSEEGIEQRKDLEKKIKKTTHVVNVVNNKETNEDNKEEERLKTIGILLDPGIEMAIAIMAALKAGKTFVPLDPTAPENSQLYLLEDSEARVILTANRHLQLTERLRDKCNRNIKILSINIDNLDKFEPFQEKAVPINENIKILPPPVAYLLYPPDSLGNPGINASVVDLYTALVETRESYTLTAADHQPLLGSAPLSAQLRDYLLKELPDYMVPSYFVQMDKIPLTPNGKVDRKALPDPQLKENIDLIAPGNQLEEKLTGMWAEVLGVKKDIIGINSNFFALGGHSLNATLLVSRIHKELKVKFPLAEFFKDPTIKGLSRYLQDAEEETFASIELAEKKEYYPLTSAQKRLFLAQQLQLQSTSYNIYQLVHLNENVIREKLEETFGRLIARHESFRTSFEVIGDETVQRISNHVNLAVEYYEEGNITQGVTTGSGAEIIKNFVRPFDLSQAPLLRVRLVKTKTLHNLLLIDMHHIIADVTSMNILTREFIALYTGTKLDPIRLHYKDFSQWQNNSLRKEQIGQQKKYWLELFSDADRLLPLHLPTDFERPSVRNPAGDAVTFELTEAEIRFLRETAEKCGGTLYMSLLAVLNIFLTKLTGQEDIVVGMPIEGRRHIDLEYVVGLFINTLPIRNFPTKEKTFNDFLLEIKHRVWETLENQDYQFEDLVNEIGLKRDPARNLLIEVVLNFIDRSNQVFVDSPRTIETNENDENNDYEYEKQTSNFDIVFTGVDLGHSLFVSFIYSTKLFKEETIHRFIGYFRGIMATLRENSNIKLGEISISHDLAESRIDTKEEEYLDFEF